MLNGSNGAKRGPGWHDLVRVAARASVDPRSVRNYLDGKNTRATTQRRIEKGLAACGFADYVRKVG